MTASLYPVFLKLDGLPVVVVGGGPIAAGKLDGLLAAGAKVLVVAPKITHAIRVQAGPNVELVERAFIPSDLDGARWVVAAAPTEVNQQVAHAAAEHERVATLQAHDLLSALRGLDHQAVDALLIDRVPTGALADGEPLRLRRELQEVLLHERVVQHEVRIAQAPERAQREQLGVSGASPDERDESGHAAPRSSATMSAR